MDEIHNYVLDQDNIARILNQIQIAQPMNTSDRPPAQQNHVKCKTLFPDLLVPRFADTLFWCFYIIRNGVSEYELIRGQGFREEKETKIGLVGDVRRNSAILKTQHCSRSRIEDELVNQQEISLSTFFCLCVIFSVDVVVLDDRILYECREHSSDSTTRIISKTPDGYALCISDPNVVSERLAKYRDTFWTISNFWKPLRGISHYCIRDLRDICLRLQLPVKDSDGKRLPKKNLYDLIAASFKN